MWVAVTIWSSPLAWPPKHEVAFQECSVPRVVRDQHPSVVSNLELGRDRSLSTTRVHHNVQSCPQARPFTESLPTHSHSLKVSVQETNVRRKIPLLPHITQWEPMWEKARSNNCLQKEGCFYTHSMSLEGNSFPPFRFCHFPSIKISKVSYNL